MPLIQGTTSGSIKSVALKIPCRIKSFSLFNRTSGTVVSSIGVVISGTDRYIYQANLAAVGSANSSYLVKTDILVPANAQILVVASGSIDYVITVE